VCVWLFSEELNTQCNLFNCEERAVRDWNSISIQINVSSLNVIEVPDNSSMTASLISNFWVVFCVRGIRLLPSRELPNNLLFFYSLSISKGVTPIILSQLRPLYCPPQTSMSPYNLWKPLFSHFHTDNPYR